MFSEVQTGEDELASRIFPCSPPDPLPTLPHPVLCPSCWSVGPAARYLLFGFPLCYPEECIDRQSGKEKSWDPYSTDVLLLGPLRLVLSSTKVGGLLVPLSLSRSLALSFIVIVFPLNLSGLRMVRCMIFLLPAYTNHCCFCYVNTFIKCPFIKLSLITRLQCAISFLQGTWLIQMISLWIRTVTWKT